MAWLKKKEAQGKKGMPYHVTVLFLSDYSSFVSI
jgi:hypothetical protein